MSEISNFKDKQIFACICTICTIGHSRTLAVVKLYNLFFFISLAVYPYLLHFSVRFVNFLKYKNMAVVLDEFNFETLVIAQDLLNAGEECTLRGLNYTAKWYSNS